MPLNPFDPEREAPENARLRKAVARLRDDPTLENRATVHKHLAAGPLLVALRELPRGVGSQPGGLAGELRVELVTAEGPEKKPVVAGFTDSDAVAAKAPSAVWLAIAPRALLHWILEEEIEGLLLNPGGASAFVSREAIYPILGLERPKRRAGKPLSISAEPENTMREALGQLIESGEPGAFLIAREPRTGKFVRFSPEAGGALLMDVPAEILGRDEHKRAQMMFDELAGYAEGAPAAQDEDGGEAVQFVALFSGDVGHAAKAALKVFTWVFGFPTDFELEIEERESG